jgi:hypothetical protein
MPEELFFLTVFSLAAALWLLTPVVRALADRIRQRPTDGEAKRDLERMREELTGEVHQLRLEMSELGERLDFTERLLAKQQQALPRPGA